MKKAYNSSFAEWKEKKSIALILFNTANTTEYFVAVAK